MLLYDDLGIVYLFHPFFVFEWDGSQAYLPLIPWCPIFLEVLSGVYADIIIFFIYIFDLYNRLIYIYLKNIFGW